MTAHDLASRWAALFGLALTPLFEEEDASPPGSHSVLLDGGYGSFALSASNERIWKNRTAADWSWSSNLPHHVTVTDREVAVVRWDKRSPELLTRSSVENQIEQFYEYLAADRVKSNQRVVDHMMTIFRRVRSLVANAHIDDHRSIDAYLAFLAHAIEQTDGTDHVVRSVGSTHPEGEELLRSLSVSGIDSLFADMTSASPTESRPTLVPSLAIRHAGSEIFQEAHFELLRVPNPDLFGYVGPAESKQVTRGGAHFTPPALARSVVEQTLAQLPDLANRKRLVILDPACGSGAFLHEALRTLRRTDFHGRLSVAGRDTSQPAISMATFVLNNASADWSPAGGCEIDIQQADSLAGALPTADIVLMNPPFVAWPALSGEQRQQMQAVLGPRMQGRGDLSMAFVTRALESLAPGGALGTLLPGSLLSLKAAEAWRKDLLDQSDVRFIASLGDYHLFTYAHVQVAAVVLAKPQTDRDRRESVTALVTANDPEATGNALRKLRLTKHSPPDLLDDTTWSLFHISAGNLRRRATWRLTSSRTEQALSRLVDVGGAVPIGDLFDVRQGVRTGSNSVFLLTTSQVEDLPPKERKWFQPAIMNESIKHGEIDVSHRVFYPYNQLGLAITSEVELIRQTPVYFERYLQPERIQLERRASVVRASRPDWWGLSERRAWALDPQPRLVSKYFGGTGGFATDLEARYIVVQGFAWFPKWKSPVEDIETEAVPPGFPMKDLLAAYMAVMNSTPFGRLLEIFSPHVAGGQFDLSARYVNSIPVPNLPVLSADQRTSQLIIHLAELGNTPRLSDLNWSVTADRLATDLYGDDILRQL